MNSFHALRRKRLSAILGIEHRCTEFPDPEIIIGINANLAVVGRARIGIAHLLPGLAFVLAAISPALVVLHDGVNNGGVLAVDVQPDAPGCSAVLIRQAFGQFFPGCAAVGCLIDGTVRSAAIESEGGPPPLIRRGIQRVRTLRVHGDVAHPGVIVDLQHLRPGLPAVRRLIHATVRIRSPQMS